MEEKELVLDLDFSDLIYDYENRVPCIYGAALMEQDFVPAEFVVKWIECPRFSRADCTKTAK